jgi:hypothetical protein
MPSKKKKTKGKKKSSAQTDDSIAQEISSDGSTAPSSCWSDNDECAYYAKLGE